MGASRFALVHDARDAWPRGRAEERIRAALGDGTQVRARGPLVVGWREGAGGPALLRDADDSLLLIDGVLDSHADELARALPAGPAAALRVLRGEACVLWWDGRRGVVLRDHVGVRPAVWSARQGPLVAASHERDLLELLPRTPGADQAALAAFVASRAQPPARTLLEGVHRLPGGWALELSARPRASCAWRPRYAPPERLAPEEAVARAAGALARSVARRSLGPQRTAVMLSGGVDSSSVAAFAARRVPEDQRVARALAAAFPDHPQADESDRIRAVAGALGLRLDVLEVRGSAPLAGAASYAERWRVPALSPNVGFWPLLLDRAREEGIEVVLDGEGGDEVFGAPLLLLADLLRRGRIRAARRLLGDFPSRNEAGLSPESRRHVLRSVGVQGALPGLAERLGLGVEPPVPAHLRPEAARLLGSAARPWAWKLRRGPRWWAHQVDATITGAAPAQGADHVARRAAGSGVLSRHPLKDLDLVLTLQGMDPLVHFGRRSRPLLRAATAGLVPDDVRLRRDKSPFDAVFHAGLAGDLDATRHLLDRRALVADVADLDAAREALLGGPPAVAGERLLWGVWLWRLVAAELWLSVLARDGRAQEAAEAASGVQARWAGPHLR